MNADSLRIVITGVGLETPLGRDAGSVLSRMAAGERAFAPPAHFSGDLFSCPLIAEVQDFAPDGVIEPKLRRLMSREAQLAVAAAHRALADAGIAVGREVAPEDIGLFGATGMAGMPLSEVEPLLAASAGPDGRFDVHRFGQAGLRAVNPLLSFRILNNMPICLVSICESVAGANAVYGPWEGQGARALEAAVRALEWGDAACCMAGGSDVKTHELALLALQQQGALSDETDGGEGVVPGEGAAFVLLEEENRARSRGARICARMVAIAFKDDALAPFAQSTFSAVVGAAGYAAAAATENRALTHWGIHAERVVRPKLHLGDLFAGAAAVQLALGAAWARQLGAGSRVLARCAGHGGESAAFVLEGA